MAAREIGQDFTVRGAFGARGAVTLHGHLLLDLTTGTRIDDLDVDDVSCVICNTTVETEITGFAAGAKRNVLYVANRQSSSANVVLSARDTNSGSDNRITTDVDVVIAPGYGATFVWSELLSSGGGWRCVGRYAEKAPAPLLTLTLQQDTQSTQYGSGTKLILGRRYFDPTDAAYGLSASSTATFYALIETSDGANSAHVDLFQETGIGAPQVVATPSSSTSTTAALVSAACSPFFVNSAAAAIFVARLWVNTPNGKDEATCSAAWIEVTTP